MREREFLPGGAGLGGDLIRRGGRVFETNPEILYQVTGGTERTRPVGGECTQFTGILVARLAAAFMNRGVWTTGMDRRRR